MTIETFRRPLFGRHGHLVVAVLCGYEVAAIASGHAPALPSLPTLTNLGRRYPAVKWALSGALLHHFHLELVEVITPTETQ